MPAPKTPRLVVPPAVQMARPFAVTTRAAMELVPAKKCVSLLSWIPARMAAIAERDSNVAPPADVATDFATTTPEPIRSYAARLGRFADSEPELAPNAALVALEPGGKARYT